MPDKKISVVIPCRNEAENLGFLLDEIDTAMTGRNYEVLVVDDGSTDATAKLLASRMEDGKPLRHIRHDRSSGQSCALRSGVYAASGDIIVSLDGDGQNDPAYLPQLVDRLTAGGESVGLVAGQRLKRTDTKLKQLSSRMANGLRQAILKDNTRDSGCGLKAVRADIFKKLPYFNGWHRYLPALVLREGYQVGHLDVIDRERVHGKSNYGILDRALVGVLDLFGVWWLRRRFKIVPKVSEIKLNPATKLDEAPKLDEVKGNN